MRKCMLVASALGFALTAPTYASAQLSEQLLNLVENLRDEVAALKEQVQELERQPGPKGDKGDPGASGEDGRDATVPSGAVVAFLSSQTNPCPGNGWELYEPAMGRVIVGAGHGDRSQLTPRKIGDVGGAEVHALTTAEMPSHEHESGSLMATMNNSIFHMTDYGVNVGPGLIAKGSLWGSHPEQQRSLESGAHEHSISGTVKAEGGGSAHNNMPPFIALYFCKKTE